MSADGAVGDYTWLFDAEVWRVVPTSESTCEVFQADVAKLRWPGHDWQPCGPGCRTAEAAPGGAPYWVPSAATAVRVLASTAYLSLSPTFKAAGLPITLAGVWELETGQPRIMLQTRNFECAVMIAGPASPFLFEVTRNKDPFKLSPGLFSLQDGSVTWGAPPLETGMASFDFVTGWGGVFGFSSVAFTTDPTSTALSVAYTAGFIRRPASTGDEIFLPEWGSATGAIRGWMPGATVRTVAEGDWLPATVAASANKVTWLGVHGPQAFEGSFERSELYWSGRSATTTVEQIPNIPVPGLPWGFFTADDFVSLGGCWDGCRVLVADLVNKKLWAIPAPSGHPMYVIGMTDTEVVAGEQRDASQPMLFQALYRYDLTRLGEYALEL